MGEREKCPGVKGDIIRFDRGDYFHFAIHYSECEVIHFHRTESNSKGCCASVSASSNVASSGVGNGSVTVEKYSVVRNGDVAELAPKPESILGKAYDGEEVLKRAQERKRQFDNDPKAYSLYSHNCEHFANYCRYGESKSEQVEGALYVFAFAIVIYGFLRIFFMKRR